MSVSSLTKMTVPIASDQSATGQGLLMPKLQYRFRIVFENLGVSTPRTELTKQVMTASRPSISHTDIPVHVYNSVIHLAGKHEWADFTCKFRDDVTGAVSKLLGEQLQKQLDYMEQASASSGSDYKFTTRLEMLDGGNGAHEPIVLETWEMYGCYLQAVNYGSLDYSASSVVEIDMTMKFDNAIQTPIGAGIGADVGRSLGSVIN